MSAPSRSIIFTSKARADFTSIMQYTAEQWGERQRDTYAQRLTNGMGKLTRLPHLGEARDDFSQGPQARVIEQHAVYYRVDA
jgi:plasmid stabilization system protein ParE